MQVTVRNIIKNNKLLCYGGCLISILFCIAVTLMPLISQYLIDVVLSTSQREQVYYGVLIFFAVCILQPCLYAIKEKIFVRLSERITYNLRLDSFRKLSNLPLTYYETHNYGEISVKTISDTREIGSFIYVLFSSLITSVLSIICIFIAMFLQSWFLSLIIVGLFVIYVVLNIRIAKKLKNYSKESIKLSEIMQGTIKHTFDNATLMKVFAANTIYKNKATEIVSDMQNNNLLIRNTSNRLNAMSMSITAIALCIVYGIGAIMIIDNMTTIGIVISMGLFFQSLSSPLSSLVRCNIGFNRVKPSIERINELLEEKEETGEMVLENIKPSIQFNNVDFRYPQTSEDVISGFSMEINTNGCYAICGESGCGKSTIAKLIMGLYEPQNGEVKVFDVNTKDLNKIWLRNHIGYIPQDVELTNDTILNNLRISNTNLSMEKVIEICKMLKIHEKIMSLPDDYYSFVNEKINLSGGERRRIGIARAILSKMPIYIFDEAETYLEENFQLILKNLFNILGKESIVVVITHNKKLVENFNNIYEIKEMGNDEKNS